MKTYFNNWASFSNLQRHRAILFMLIIISVQSTLSFAQCPVSKADRKNEVKVNIAQSYKSNLPPFYRALRIVVKQKDFTHDSMVRLAKTIRNKFCQDDEITAIIFDDKRVAMTMDEGQYLIGEIKVPEVRGFYSYSKEDNYEGIEFSTERGKPFNEVRIKLSSD